ERRVSELTVPKGVTILADPDELVVKIIPKRELKVEEEVPVAEAEVPVEGEAAAEGEAPAGEEAAESEE
ncbi:MAG TPA: 50S ribosomal protein L25, partial [Candidatus Dormibacteraeota bacterium]|nr:50S ribosomal protein L25 [Candidatus Dormibacteraeota bacterium]